MKNTLTTWIPILVVLAAPGRAALAQPVEYVLSLGGTLSPVFEDEYELIDGHQVDAELSPGLLVEAEASLWSVVTAGMRFEYIKLVGRADDFYMIAPGGWLGIKSPRSPIFPEFFLKVGAGSQFADVGDSEFYGRNASWSLTLFGSAGVRYLTRVAEDAPLLGVSTSLDGHLFAGLFLSAWTFSLAVGF